MWTPATRSRRDRTGRSRLRPRFERLEGRAVPAVIPVSSLADSGPGTLRAAIAQADMDTTPDTIAFAPGVTGTITLASALPDLSAAITLEGPGPSLLRVARSAAPGTPAFRILSVPAGAEVTVSGLTLSGGQDNDPYTGGGGILNLGTLTVTGSVITGNSAGAGGGLDNDGALTVTGSVITGNSAVGDFGSGGGLYNDGGTLTVNDSTVSDNTANSGGGITNHGTLTVTDSTVSGNSAGGYGSDGGGGIFNVGPLTVTGSLITGNSASGGGGIENYKTLTLTDSIIRGNTALDIGAGLEGTDQSTQTVSDCTISGNSATTSGSIGGGIDTGFQATLTVTDSTISGNSAADFAGGIDNGGTLTLTGSTVSGNSAGGIGGGGIYNVDVATVINCTLSGNSAVSTGGGIFDQYLLTVVNSTLSGNTAGAGGGLFTEAPAVATVATSIFANPDDNLVRQSGAIVSRGRNLFSDAPALPLDPTDLVNTNPLLGPLADNGGPTQTLALLPGSPAIDAGVSLSYVTTDQRGVARPRGKAADLGAFESRGFTLAVVGGAGQSAATDTPFPAPLVVSVSSPFGEPVVGGLVTFTSPSSGPSARLSGSPSTVGVDGRAGVNASANGIGSTYAVIARATGADSVTLGLTNLAPAVAGLQRTGIHDQPTRLVLTFNLPMNAATVQDLRNYLLYRIGPHGYGGPNPRPIPIVSAVYDPTARAVTLTPQTRLRLRRYYLLTVSGLPGEFLAVVHGDGPTVVPARASAVPAGPRPPAKPAARR